MSDVRIGYVNNGNVIGTSVGFAASLMAGGDVVNNGGSGSTPPTLDAQTWNEMQAQGISWDEMGVGSIYEKTWDELL